MPGDISIRDRAYRTRVKRIRERAIFAVRQVAFFDHWADMNAPKSFRFTPEAKHARQVFALCLEIATRIHSNETTEENDVVGGWAVGLPQLADSLEDLGRAAQQAGEEAIKLSKSSFSGMPDVDPDGVLPDIASAMLVQVAPLSLLDALWCARADREREREEAQNSDAYRKKRSRKRHAAGYRSFRAELHDNDIRALRDVGLLVGDLDDKMAVEVALDGLIQTVMATLPVKGEVPSSHRRYAKFSETEGAKVYAALIERLTSLTRFDRV